MYICTHPLHPYLLPRWSACRTLSEDRPHVLLNQFPCETIVTTKDCLASVARRARRAGRAPRWLPTTFNLQTELPQFIKHYLQRQERWVGVQRRIHTRIATFSVALLDDHVDDTCRARFIKKEIFFFLHIHFAIARAVYRERQCWLVSEGLMAHRILTWSYHSLAHYSNVASESCRSELKHVIEVCCAEN